MSASMRAVSAVVKAVWRPSTSSKPGLRRSRQAHKTRAVCAVMHGEVGTACAARRSSHTRVMLQQELGVKIGAKGGGDALDRLQLRLQLHALRVARHFLGLHQTRQAAKMRTVSSRMRVKRQRANPQ